MLLAESIETTTGESIMTAGEVAEDFNNHANAIVEYFKSHVNDLINIGIKLAIGIILFLVGRLIIKLILKVCDRFLERTGADIGVTKFLNSLLKVLMYLVLIIIVCAQIGINTSSFIALIGSAGLALGLSLQGSLANFAGGILILIIKPFSVGDYIIDSGSSKEGTVSRIDLFYTHLTTVDNKKVVIPNGSITNNCITNVTFYDKRIIDFKIGISYDSDIKKAKKVLEEVAKSHDLVLKEEKIFVFVDNLDESQVTIGMRVWTKKADYWQAYYDLNEKIKEAFDENLIEIPYRKLDVNIKEI